MAKKKRHLTAKAERCVKELKRDPDVDNPYAVCNKSIKDGFFRNHYKKGSK